MSGWVKMDKDLETDPRVRRMAKSLCDANALQGVTLVVGGLTRLWMHADSHIREDDSLDMSTTEIDEWLAIPGFCAQLPKEWLRPINATAVELPGFQAHNGVEAKRRALTQKRMTQYRHRLKRNSVTLASPDQTKTRPRPRPDQGRGEARAARSPATLLPSDFRLTDDRKAVAILEHLDPERTFKKFTNYWKAATGPKARKRDWDATWQNWCLNETDRHHGNGSHKPRKTRFEEVTEHLREK